FGQRDRQLQVQVDPAQLRAKDVSLLQVIETTGNALWVSPLTFLEASTPGTSGFLDMPNQRIGIQHILPIKTPQDLAQVTVEDKAPLRLGDVAKVVEDHQPLIGDAVTAAGPGDLLLVIQKFPEANTLKVTQGVEQALDDLSPGLPGIQIDTTLYRPASFVEAATRNLAVSLLVGLFLLVVVLGALFFDWRAALIGLVAIPLSLMAAAIVLHLRGATINTMTIAGLVAALGILIDDAVVDVDAIARRLREQRRMGSTTSTARIILDGSLEVRSPLIAATVIILLALLPIYYLGSLGDLPGPFFRPLALSYALAILASMLVALTVTPALALFLLPSGRAERREAPLLHRLQDGYDRLLTRTIHRSYAPYAVVAVVSLLGLATLPLLRESMLPSFQDRDLLIHWEAVPGTSEPEMSRITARAAAALLALAAARAGAAPRGR
ncbi:MAG: efflux RND transporter permease subunit, partial [Thermomicrobiaceae bacterium]|nr:efflux RND transporter permease subunit [Thermomicrobiaceae bacterium]